MEFWSALIQVVLIGIALAMDAFAVSICDGLSITDLNNKKRVFISSTFGIMQGLMPLIGYFVGALFYQYIKDFDHWIAFGLLLIIGGKMVFDGIKALVKPEQSEPKTFSYKEVLVQGIATSIDALIVGITLNSISFGLIGSNNFDWSIFIEVLIIAVITFTISLVGILLGGGINKLLHGKYEVADIIGGIILIGIGVKVVLDHMVFGGSDVSSISGTQAAIDTFMNVVLRK